jgi:hypothetical protein
LRLVCGSLDVQWLLRRTRIRKGRVCRLKSGTHRRLVSDERHARSATDREQITAYGVQERRDMTTVDTLTAAFTALTDDELDNVEYHRQQGTGVCCGPNESSFYYRDGRL